jgi:SAM-dependent methyltransferase
MHHVLEHVEDPVGFLKMVREVLRPGGVVHIAVPNAACWEARLSGWNCYVSYHMAYFNRNTLARATREAGLTPLSTYTHESFSTWFLTIVRVSLAIGDRQAATDCGIAQQGPLTPGRRLLIEHPYRLAMVGAGFVTWPIRHLQGVIGRGDELIMVACKGT